MEWTTVSSEFRLFRETTNFLNSVSSRNSEPKIYRNFVTNHSEAENFRRNSLRIIPKLKIFSSKSVTNHSEAGNFRRNSLRIILKLKIFVGIRFRYHICGIRSVSNLRSWEKSVKSVLLFCKDLLFRVI